MRLAAEATLQFAQAGALHCQIAWIPQWPEDCSHHAGLDTRVSALEQKLYAPRYEQNYTYYISTRVAQAADPQWGKL